MATFSGPWTNEDLAVVLDVFKKIPVADRGALSGIVLKRVATIANDAPAGSDWHTLAYFSHQRGYHGSTIVRKDEMVVSNAALEAARGSRRTRGEAEQTIAHEAAHAVESESKRRLQLTEAEAAVAYNATIPAKNAAWQTYDTVRTGSYNTEYTAYQAALAARNDAAEVAERARVAANTANAEYQARYQEYSDAFDHRSPDLKGVMAAMERAQARKNQAKATYDQHLAAFEAKDRALTAVSARLAQARQRLDELEAAFEAEKRNVDAARARLDAAEGAVARVYSAAEGKTHRVLNFFRFVTDNAIRPDITAYAKREWPGKPGEFYAEAYAFWVTDPERLRGHSEALLGYFNQGRHRNDAPPA